MPSHGGGFEDVTQAYKRVLTELVGEAGIRGMHTHQIGRGFNTAVELGLAHKKGVMSKTIAPANAEAQQTIITAMRNAGYPGQTYG